MNLYLVKRPDEDVLYDQNGGFVIAANSHSEARTIAADHSTAAIGRERPGVWLDPDSSSCKQIGICTLSLKQGKILLKDFYEA